MTTSRPYFDRTNSTIRTFKRILYSTIVWRTHVFVNKCYCILSRCLFLLFFSQGHVFWSTFFRFLSVLTEKKSTNRGRKRKQMFFFVPVLISVSKDFRRNLRVWIIRGEGERLNLRRNWVRARDVKEQCAWAVRVSAFYWVCKTWV